jgi:hypothetical protein
MLGGASLLAVPVAVGGLSGIVRAAAVGVLGPLSLRSPVLEEKEVKGVTYNIGFTYIYDFFWRDYHRNLDTVMSSLRVSDRTKALQDLKANGWTAEVLAERLRVHIAALTTRDDQEKADLDFRIAAALSDPDEDQKLRSIIELVRVEKLGSILASCRKVRPAGPDV